MRRAIREHLRRTSSRSSRSPSSRCGDAALHLLPAEGRAAGMGPRPRPGVLRAHRPSSNRAGGDPRSGPGDRHRRHPGRQGRRGRARGRARRRRMDIEPKYMELIHADATLLTAAENQPQRHGRSRSTRGPRARRRPRARPSRWRRREPNINPDEILATLDADTREYLHAAARGRRPRARRRGTPALGGSAALRAVRPRHRPDRQRS